MVCCMNQRDRRQLSALNWRWKTVFSRNKAAVRKILIMAIALTGGWVGLYMGTIKTVKPQNIKPIDYYNIANPSMEYQNSNFCKDVADGYTCSTNNELDVDQFNQYQTFYNCSKYDATRVAVITSSNSDTNVDNPTLANNILTKIVDDVSNAYYENTKKNGTFEPVYFTKVEYTSQKELQSFVTSPSYVKEQICFSIGWKEFNQETNTFDLDLKYIYTSVPNTVYPSESEGTEYAASNAWMLFDNGYLNIMSVATNRIAKEVFFDDDSKELQFQLMYTNIETGDFVDNSAIAIGCMFLAAFVINAYNDTAEGFSRFANEVGENEVKVQWILKRNGMREIVLVSYQLLYYFVPMLILNAINTTVFYFLGFNFVNFFLLYLLGLVFFLSMLIFNLIVDNAMKTVPVLRALFMTLYIMIQIIINFLVALTTTPNAIFLICSSIFPLPYFTNVTRFALAAQNLDIVIGFDNFASQDI